MEDCCTDGQLRRIAGKYNGDIMDLGLIYLNMEDAEVNDIIEENTNNKDRAYAMLSKWKKKVKDNTTRALYEALKDDPGISNESLSDILKLHDEKGESSLKRTEAETNDLADQSSCSKKRKNTSFPKQKNTILQVLGREQGKIEGVTVKVLKEGMPFLTQEAGDAVVKTKIFVLADSTALMRAICSTPKFDHILKKGKCITLQDTFFVRDTIYITRLSSIIPSPETSIEISSTIMEEAEVIPIKHLSKKMPIKKLLLEKYFLGDIECTIMTVYRSRVKGKEDSEYTLRQILVADKSMTYTVTLWNELAKKTIIEGMKIQLTHMRSKQGKNKTGTQVIVSTKYSKMKVLEDVDVSQKPEHELQEFKAYRSGARLTMKKVEQYVVYPICSQCESESKKCLREPYMYCYRCNKSKKGKSVSYYAYAKVRVIFEENVFVMTVFVQDIRNFLSNLGEDAPLPELLKENEDQTQQILNKLMPVDVNANLDLEDETVSDISVIQSPKSEVLNNS